MSSHRKRVGVAFTKPRGPTLRREQYGLFLLPDWTEGKLYAQYEGYRETRPDGEAIVGLPSGGPGWREEPTVEFRPRDFDVVRMFL